MNGRRITPRATLAAIAALTGLALPPHARAQQETGSVYDFRLPPSSPKPSAPLQGPVDPDAPVILPPSSSPEPVVSASPSARPPAPLPTAKTRGTAPPQVSSPAPTRAAAPSAESIPEPSFLPHDGAPPPASDPAIAAPPAPDSTAGEPAAPPPASGEIPLWPWAAGGLALLIGAALLWWRRRRPMEVIREEELTEVPADPVRPAPTAPADLVKAPAAEPTPPAREPAPVPVAATLELAFEPMRMSASLIFATLHYRLNLTNHSSVALGPFAIAADMISAHASLSQADQLSPDIAALTELHRMVSLQPGETAELTGDIRLPLAAVTPIHSGNARLLVPLVRLRAIGGEADHRIVLGGGNFVVGEPSEAPGGKLRPFRLDLGPRTFSGVAQRKLALAA